MTLVCVGLLPHVFCDFLKIWVHVSRNFSLEILNMIQFRKNLYLHLLDPIRALSNHVHISLNTQLEIYWVATPIVWIQDPNLLRAKGLDSSSQGRLFPFQIQVWDSRISLLSPYDTWVSIFFPSSSVEGGMSQIFAEGFAVPFTFHLISACESGKLEKLRLGCNQLLGLVFFYLD